MFTCSKIKSQYIQPKKKKHLREGTDVHVDILIATEIWLAYFATSRVKTSSPYGQRHAHYCHEKKEVQYKLQCKHSTLFSELLMA